MRTIFSLTAAIVPLLLSCTNEEENKLSSTAYQTINIQTEVNELHTRASYENNNLQELGFCVFNPVSKAHCYTNIRVNRTSIQDEWIADRQMLWQNNEQAVDLLAYAPYREGNIDFSTTDMHVSVKQDQTIEENERHSDLLLFKQAGFVPANGLINDKVNLRLSHALSKLIINITLNAPANGFNDDLKNNPISNVSVHGTIIEGVCDLSATLPEVQKAVADTASVLPYCNEYLQPSGKESDGIARYECILLPQTIAANGFFITFRLNGKEYKWISENALTLSKGTQYTLPLSVLPVIPTVTITKDDITATPWDTVTEQDIPIEAQ